MLQKQHARYHLVFYLSVLIYLLREVVESLSAPESFKTPLNKALMNRLLGAITNCLGMDKIKYEVFIQLSSVEIEH